MVFSERLTMASTELESVGLYYDQQSQDHGVVVGVYIAARLIDARKTRPILYRRKHKLITEQVCLIRTLQMENQQLATIV